MLSDPLHKMCCTCLRLKKGEYNALAALAENVKHHVLPYLIAPPPKDKDPEHGRRLTREELFFETARRIGKHWPLRPAILDTSYIADALGSMNAHEWLPQLYDYIRRINGNCIPALNFESSSSERLGVKEIYHKQGGYITVRVPISYVDDPLLFKKIYDIVNVVGCGSRRTILLLDCEDMSLDPTVDTFPIVKNAIESILSLGDWAKVIFVATCYPDSNPAKQNGYHQVNRLEVEIWKMLKNERTFERANLTYGDYGADCALIDFSTRKFRNTIPHLRLSNPNAIHVFRGGKNLGDHDNGTIRSVAKRILESPYFETPVSSAAEEFITECAENTGPPGNATTWRSINTIRHITCTVNTLLEIEGTSLPKRPRRTRFKQMSFLDGV